MIDKVQTLLFIFITPFVVSASCEFLPGWVSWPVCVLGSMLWFGSLFMLSEKKNDKT
jgi:uncharacterized integral membrane protein